MEDFAYQAAGLNATLDAIDSGVRRILCVAPTGAGKTRVIRRLVERCNDWRWPSILYTNRRLLIDQLVADFTDSRISHGVRAAGYEPDLDAPFQISSIQTESSRVLKKKQWKLHEAKLVLIDEAHLQTADVARELLDRHLAAGGSYVGFTATPLDLQDLYDTLIQFAVTSECRAAGALVAADHYGPDEPDWAAFKKAKKLAIADGADLTEKQARAVMMTPGIFGRVWESFEKLNPRHLPTLLFAPAVAESIWFAEQFTKKGVPWAHFDGKDIWLNGTLQTSTPDLREHVIMQHRKGKIVGLSNRFVLREGIDLPWVRHIVAATIFGSVGTFLQSLGRGLRADRYEDTNSLFGPKARLVIQDHGGNWHRHGSINSDIRWHMEDTSLTVFNMRADRLRANPRTEPRCCPDCGRIVACDPCPPPCGHKFAGERKSRPVIGTDGQLRQMSGDIFRKRRISTQADGPRIWSRMVLFRAPKNGKSFHALAALYAYENNWQWPNPEWPLMPTQPRDWHRKVTDVPKSSLTGNYDGSSREESLFAPVVPGETSGR